MKAMELRVRRPRPPLSQFVHVFWSFQGESPSCHLERLLPDGSIELVINLREDCVRVYDREDHSKVQTFPGSILAGPHSQFFVIDTETQTSTVGIHFKPGGAFPFLGMPAGLLHDSHVALDTVWGGFVSEVRERLLEAETVELRLQILEQALLARATRPLELHAAINFALDEFQAAPHMRTITEVTGDLGLSPRRFIELFRDQVGMTPKLFCRVRRFQRAVQSIGAGKDVEWTDLALDCGYFDQAHFIHDFRAFSGVSPTAYSAMHLRNANHVPM
jgi:AraC-like DNA-binding protein